MDGPKVEIKACSCPDDAEGEHSEDCRLREVCELKGVIEEEGKRGQDQRGDDQLKRQCDSPRDCGEVGTLISLLLDIPVH